MTAALKIKLPTIKSQCYQTLDMKPRVVSRSHCGVYRTPYRTAGYTVPYRTPYHTRDCNSRSIRSAFRVEWINNEGDIEKEIRLYRTVLYRTVLYYTVLYCTVKNYKICREQTSK